jgi:hypothetical protein
MNLKRFLRVDSDSGSITAEAAVAISIIAVFGLGLIQILTFAMQFQRLQTLAQESSRVAASLGDPALLEMELKDFLFEIDPDISMSVSWEDSQVQVTLQEPTTGVASQFSKVVEATATSPRWSG